MFRTARNDDEQLMRSRLQMSNHFIPASPGLDGNLEQLCRLDPVYTFPSWNDTVARENGIRRVVTLDLGSVAPPENHPD